jgi:hypothetical protein
VPRHLVWKMSQVAKPHRHAICNIICHGKSFGYQNLYKMTLLLSATFPSRAFSTISGNLSPQEKATSHKPSWESRRPPWEGQARLGTLRSVPIWAGCFRPPSPFAPVASLRKLHLGDSGRKEGSELADSILKSGSRFCPRLLLQLPA